MGQQIIKQPDGRFAVFSTYTDTLVIVDATPDELADHYADMAATEARERTWRIVADVDAGVSRNVYYQFTMTFDEALEKSRAHDGDLVPECTEAHPRA